MPSILRPECDAFVDEYLPIVVARLLLGHNATSVCQDLHLCVAPVAVTTVPVKQQPFRPISIVELDAPLRADKK